MQVHGNVWTLLPKPAATKPSLMDTPPEILFSQGIDQAQSKRVRRLAARGELRKLYAGVYRTGELVKSCELPLEYSTHRARSLTAKAGRQVARLDPSDPRLRPLPHRQPSASARPTPPQPPLPAPPWRPPWPSTPVQTWPSTLTNPPLGTKGSEITTPSDPPGTKALPESSPEPYIPQGVHVTKNNGLEQPAHAATSAAV